MLGWTLGRTTASTLNCLSWLPAQGGTFGWETLDIVVTTLIEDTSQQACQLFIGDVGSNELYSLQACDDLSEDRLRDAGNVHIFIHLQLLQTQTCPQMCE